MYEIRWKEQVPKSCGRWQLCDDQVADTCCGLVLPCSFAGPSPSLAPPHGRVGPGASHPDPEHHPMPPSMHQQSPTGKTTCTGSMVMKSKSSFICVSVSLVSFAFPSVPCEWPCSGTKTGWEKRRWWGNGQWWRSRSPNRRCRALVTSQETGWWVNMLWKWPNYDKLPLSWNNWTRKLY